MRNPDRIPEITMALYGLWTKYPDLRFGQLIENVKRQYEMEFKTDMFYVEDNKMLEWLKELSL